ncbi:MAG TPA: methyltransferase domain-containing protein [Xanthobacteraceae bacterium]|nr:methyltransferase domain-containing protein [Xanthobacteraceae bacterium]
MNTSSGSALFQTANDLANRNQWADAREAFEAALAQHPTNAEGHNQLGFVYAQLGDGGKALRHFHQAFTLKPSLHEAFQNFGHLLTVLAEKNFTATIIKDNQAVLDLIARAKAAWPARVPAGELLSDPRFLETAKNPYLLFYLGSTRLRDAEIEQMLTMLRAALLDLAPEQTVDPHYLALTGAIACQCFANEYVFSASAEETKKVEALYKQLAADLDTGAEIPAHRLAILASYMPLHRLPNAAKLLSRAGDPGLQALLHQQVEEVQQERKIRGELPQLTPIEDETSIKVRGQYEENPYPRWIATSTPERQITFREYLTILFPHAQTRSFKDNVEVLFAGCGTGSVVAGFAQLIANAKILAVDLSLSSLSYAKRMANQYRIRNVEFGQADILQLPSLGRRFDIISSTGVMHHMAEPFHAWRTLVSMLNPGGFMHIGFYSEIARKEVSEGWAYIKKHGYGKSADEIRRFRQDVMALPDSEPMKRVLKSPDFYSTSDLRDLLFHEHELRVTIPQIKQFLKENGLEFIGWDLPLETRQLYAREFPIDAAMIELDNWQRFEEKYPRTFSQMYKFWVQKTA